MKLTTGIVAVALMVGGAYAQSSDPINNARSAVKSLQQQQAPATTAKPAPGAPAPAIKPAAIPGEKAKAPAKSASSTATNKLEHVSVVPGGSDIQIEISSSQAVTPRVTKLSSPARLLVELPETVVASAQNKIPVGSNGVKGVRIGMDGKTPPTTSVVVDLDKAMEFDLTPGPAGKVVLILHAQDAGSAVAKSAPAKATAPKTADVKAPAKPAAAAVAAAKAPAAAPKVADAKIPAAAKPTAVAKVADAKASPSKPVAAAKADSKQGKTTVVAAKPAPASAPVAVKPEDAPKPKQEEKKWAMSGKRDPFFSPVVHETGSGCSTGKKCLEIGQINLRGVVKSDTGFIAVVTNNLNKAYFLRENDPVFNGYVVKITGDSVTFQETILDKLGKSFTREVVKKIFTPAV